MAHRTALSEERPTKTPKAAKKPAGGTLANAVGSPKAAGNEERERVFDAFRRWGYLEAPPHPLRPRQLHRIRAAGSAVVTTGLHRRFACSTFRVTNPPARDT